MASQHMHWDDKFNTTHMLLTWRQQLHFCRDLQQSGNRKTDENNVHNHNNYLHCDSFHFLPFSYTLWWSSSDSMKWDFTVLTNYVKILIELGALTYIYKWNVMLVFQLQYMSAYMWEHCQMHCMSYIFTTLVKPTIMDHKQNWIQTYDEPGSYIKDNILHIKNNVR